MKNIFYPLIFILVFISKILFAEVNSFDNPIAEKRADPWVTKHLGVYYFMATVPEYDRLIIRKAATIKGLKTAQEKVIWKKHNKGVMGAHIWAPELHRIGKTWYIYFAAGEAESKWNIRMWALSNSSADPTVGEWKEEGQIVTQRDSFSLDATTFKHRGKRYLIWAQNVSDNKHGTGLLMSEMSNATTLKGPEVILTQPDFLWEKKKHDVNEGPAVFKHQGRIFVSYSASATNHNYCNGLLWADENANLLKSSSWHKSPSPVFFSNAEHKRFGPGHASFVVAEDSRTLLMVYHARDYKEIKGFELEDPNRLTRVRPVRWTISGFPDFGQALGD